ncbi:putative retrotransposon Copia-like protein [Helianthus annuus]|uniref:uncharacterized protein LOC110934714 n=1 Tax=Helianthus annuus TaxID=4232 RepID=UPI000B900317|nr:uncharacterized protein LOC110934714 [Helianthus annuus]KAJ0581298.1 putative retrotransposon Copia-like protein [Helianthus annuus]KAJ0589231.1 putative retrotransposon Copia-like protein [Helianthus annuus]KAJ0597245.1 putative retrotransposon Copia-like protein [Helianthus annuus]KAJ0757925.1 putative retrotransposon Copia-like protein [Helianthus annuus]KAJ0761592.1 putative retrotransposon Copia-like protein [Helianthus annuus]
MSSTSDATSVTTLDSSNHLYLHPSDHPGMNLVSKSFDGTRFGAWKRAMTIALSAKNKLSFVNGVSTRPNDPFLVPQWQRCNDMVISWILNTLSRGISDSVLYTETAYKLWNELNDRYGQVNGAKLYQLQKSICEISQGSNDTATYFTKIKAIWDELSALNSLPNWSCGVSHVFAKRDEDQRLVQFLTGLNASYDSIQSNILMMKPLPSISAAYAILIQDEKQREIHSTNIFAPESSSMNVTAQTSQFRTENKKVVVCSHYKKYGHTSNKCYRLVGFPKDFKFTKNKRFSANSASHVTELKEQESNGLTSDQIGELLQLLQKSYIEKAGQEDAFNTSKISHANFVGPLSEEATGSW